MSARTPFPKVFWVANTIEVLERFAYYGIYFGFGIYMTSLGYSRDQLGIVQSLFLLLSYVTPVVSGTFADRYGFKKVLIVSYLAYLPSILLLIFTKSFSGIVLTMLSIGLAAGIFKPLVSGTVRAVTDKTNKTLGFGIFYAMVNVGGSFGPFVLGQLRAISWDYAFMAAAVAIVVMLLVTIFFYEEPPREIEGVTLGQKLEDIGDDPLGPQVRRLPGAPRPLLLAARSGPSSTSAPSTWTATSTPPGSTRHWRASSGRGSRGSSRTPGEDGVRRVLGETISHTGYIIMLLQVFVSSYLEKKKALPSFMVGPRGGRPRLPRPRLRPGLDGTARLPGDLPLRGGGDDRLAAHPGVHHLDRPEGEGRPLHGHELPRRRHRGVLRAGSPTRRSTAT